MLSSACRTIYACTDVQGSFSKVLVQTHKSSLWIPPQAHYIILQAIKLIHFNWIMTPIFESVENPPHLHLYLQRQISNILTAAGLSVLLVALQPVGAKDQFAVMNLICLV